MLTMKKLAEFGGTDHSVLENNELIEIFLPGIRADFQIYVHIETSCYRLDCPLITFGSTHDICVTSNAMQSWKKYSRSAFDCYQFPGDHFYITQFSNKILEILNQFILEYSCV